MTVRAFGPYLITSACPRCRRPHVAATEHRVIAHDGYPTARETVDVEPGEVPAPTIRALARVAEKNLSTLASDIRESAASAKKAKGELPRRREEDMRP